MAAYSSASDAAVPSSVARATWPMVKVSAVICV
jgi:hypothetical protein